MKLIILAGGKGTRLGTLTESLPKPMVPVGGKPVLEHQIVWAKKQGFTECILTLNHLPDSIQNYFGDGKEWGLKINYFTEPQPMGTAGALPLLASELTETFAVLYGDVMLDIDWPRLLAFHQSKQAMATLVIHPNDHPYDSDLVDIDEASMVSAFYPKNRASDRYYRNLVNAGLYVLEPEILTHIPAGKFADFGKDLFPALVSQHKIAGYPTPEYLKDMGTPDRLEKVEKDYQSNRIQLSNLTHERPAIFLDRDGCINEEVGLIHKPEQLQLYPFAAEAIRKINKSGYLSVVVTNQSVIARNLCTENDLRHIHNKMESELGNGGAYVDALYYCPHHPHGGFPEENKAYKKDCDCRKPKSGMLLQAAEELHIALNHSWMIGDTERDIIAGKNAGTQTIGLRTGMALENTKTQPDFWMDNLMDAVNFILEPQYLNLISYLLQKLKSVSETLVLGIAGNSGSGKSTLSKRLQNAAEKSGFSTLVICLDDWLAPKTERQHMKDVFERYQMPKLIDEVSAILQGFTIEVNAYSHDPSKEREQKIYQKRPEHRLVIIEGIVCLTSLKIREILHESVYIGIEEKVLEERFMRLAKQKGYTEEEGKNLLLS